MMIDEAVRTFYGENMIRMVFYARQGKMIPQLAEELKEHPYFKMNLQKLLVEKCLESTIRKNFLKSITLMMQTTLFIP